MALNFFLEAKRPDRFAAVIKKQACYNSALSARGIQKLQSYKLEKPVYDNNTYIITSTYYDSQLKLYTIYSIELGQPKGRPEYIMTQLNSQSLIGNLKTCRQEATAFQNRKDQAKKTRNRFIKAVNTRAPGIYIESQSFTSSSSREVSISIADPTLVESDISAGETKSEDAP